MDNLRRLLGVEYRLAFFVVVLVLGVVVEGFSPFLMKYSIQKKICLKLLLTYFYKYNDNALVGTCI